MLDEGKLSKVEDLSKEFDNVDTARKVLEKDLDPRLCNPLHLRSVLEDKRYTNYRIVLLHASYPFSKEASYLASVYSQIIRVLITVLDTSADPRALIVACFDLSQFIQYHPAGQVIVTNLKEKECVMKLMNYENVEVT